MPANAERTFIRLRSDVATYRQNLKSAREAADRKAIRRVLAQTENNISAAAKLLGISRPTLYDLLKQYQLAAN